MSTIFMNDDFYSIFVDSRKKLIRKTGKKKDTITWLPEKIVACETRRQGNLKAMRGLSDRKL